MANVVDLEQEIELNALRTRKLVGLIDQLAEEDTKALADPLASAQSEGRRLKQLLASRIAPEVTGPNLHEMRLDV